MKHIYSIRDYFKSAMLPGYSTYAADSIGFLSESLYSSHRSFSGKAYAELLLSVCTIQNSFVQLVFDAEAGCTSHTCNCIRNNIARKFGIALQHIDVLKGSIDQTQSSLRAGDKVAHQSLPTWGTLGGFTIDRNRNRISHIISNNHVLANSNHARKGDSIFKKGADSRHIGMLENFVPIQFGGYANELDLAVASLDSDEFISIGGYFSHRDPRPGEIVYKIGAKTDKTYGIVQADDRVARVNYDGKLGLFVDQLLITDLNGGNAFSEGGDSGSFIFSEDGDFVGLLFAGGPIGTSANRAPVVAKKLQEWNLLH